MVIYIIIIQFISTILGLYNNNILCQTKWLKHLNKKLRISNRTCLYWQFEEILKAA